MKVEKRKIKQIKIVFYIRKDFNEAYIDGITQSIKCGETIRRIIINEDNELQEGRHTYEAYRRLIAQGFTEYETIECEIIPTTKSSLEAMIRSTKGHEKSKLPLLPADWVHSFRTLLAEGFTIKQIVQAYVSQKLLSPGRAKDYALAAESLELRPLMPRIINLMKTGKTIPEIAEKLEKSPEVIKNTLDLIKKNETRRKNENILTPLTHFKRKTHKRFYLAKHALDRSLRQLKEKQEISSATIDEYKEALDYSRQEVLPILTMLDSKDKRIKSQK